MSIFEKKSNEKEEPHKRIRITSDNLNQWPKFEKLFNEGNIKFDSNGRLRYLHGAPVGDLVLTRIRKDGIPIYKESAAEWFDPESPKALAFVWPNPPRINLLGLYRISINKIKCLVRIPTMGNKLRQRVE